MSITHEPHSHQVVVQPKYESIRWGSGPWIVRYGDLERYITYFGDVINVNTVCDRPSERRIRRAIKRVVEKHDRACRKLQQRPPTVPVEELLSETKGGWGSDVLSDKQKNVKKLKRGLQHLANSK